MAAGRRVEAVDRDDEDRDAAGREVVRVDAVRDDDAFAAERDVVECDRVPLRVVRWLAGVTRLVVWRAIYTSTRIGRMTGRRPVRSRQKRPSDADTVRRTVAGSPSPVATASRSAPSAFAANSSKSPCSRS